VLFERYRSRSALQEHRRSTHYQNYRAQLSGLLTKPIEVTVLDALDEASGKNR
jgi:quinol monooxygenase YgiN